MYNPTMRLLTILELLQSRTEVSGQELAQKLEVEERSIRRYIMMLRDLGIPIEGERGRHGGYSLRPGFRLPPMMFNKDEITAVMMGLMLMQELATDTKLAVESAIAKIQRVLPDELRDSTRALHSSLILDDVSGGLHVIGNDELALFSKAIDENFCIRIHYQGREGEGTERTIAPYGVVLHAGQWYIPAYCYLREDIRVFRLDRIVTASPTKRHFIRPADFDPRAYIIESVGKIAGEFSFEILFDTPLSTLQEVIPPTLGILETSGDKTLLRCTADDPFWIARQLVRMEVPFTVLESDELREALRVLADDILRSID